MKSAGCQSYSKRQIVPVKCIAVCFAIFASVSCEKNNGHCMFQTSESAVNSYRAYLSEMRSVESLPTEHLIEAVNDWQTLRDSVFACVAKDTANRIHSNHENTIHSLHDSLQAEFIRLAHSTPKTFKDVLLIKERTSPYRQDTELAKTVEAAKPFFDSLDSIQPYQRTAKDIYPLMKFFSPKQWNPEYAAMKNCSHLSGKKTGFSVLSLPICRNLPVPTFLSLRIARRNVAFLCSNRQRVAGCRTKKP